jgi:hypothetical protein
MNTQFGAECSVGGALYGYIAPTHQKQIPIIQVYLIGTEVPDHEYKPKVATNH